MYKLTHITSGYKYIDKASWEIINNLRLSSKELTSSILNTSLENDKQAQLDISILAFHYIWNQQNIQLAQLIVEHLLKLSEKSLHPFFYFLKSKICHFDGDYNLSLTFLDKAEEILQLNIKGNSDYRKLLTCIGSLNDTDPDNIEFSVMKAIISNEKGNNYRALGMHDHAINAFINALNLQTESYSTLLHANVAYTHRCLGKSFEEKEMHHEALEQYKKANSIAEIIYRDEYHPEAIEIKAALK